MGAIPALLVTANVGSIFEDPTNMLEIWTNEFLSKIDSFKVKFIALHCQEVGGKNYEKSMNHVEHFVKLLTNSKELASFNKNIIFLDEDFASVENFTALGNLYFIHESIENVLIWDFEKSDFTPVFGTQVFSKNIEKVTTKEKSKFPQIFFPECKWSRKGFMRTRWSLCGTIFDLVNIHLFHDASNLVAMSTTPSVYCRNRQRALEHTLSRFHNDRYDNVPVFVFGDFNFRNDNEGVIKKLSNGLTKTRVQNIKNNDHTKLHFKNEDNNLILTVGKKEFSHIDHENIFLNYEWLKMFDKETEAFKNVLKEYPVSFAPSYPFEEDIKKGNSYMPTRCPAWCDRVLFNPFSEKIIVEDYTPEYGLLGHNTCMGDHKPVYLRIGLRKNAGTVKCCEHAPFACLPDSCQCCQKFASASIYVTDMSDHENTYFNSFSERLVDLRLLNDHVSNGTFSNDPYTPESVDSRSPLPEEIDTNQKDRRTPVSPIQLKSKLEDILTNNTSSLAKQSSLDKSCSDNSNKLIYFKTAKALDLSEKQNNIDQLCTFSSSSGLKLSSLDCDSNIKANKKKVILNPNSQKLSESDNIEFKEKKNICCTII